MSKIPMKGINIGGWFSQIDAIMEKDPDFVTSIDSHISTFIKDDDISYIKQAGFDHVRIPVDYQLFFDDEGRIRHEDRMDVLERAVRTCLSVNLDVIFDLHRCPGHNFHEGWASEQTFFSDPEMRRASKKVWSYIAERFSFDTRVLFEVLNEPVAADNAVWDVVKDEMTAHIRSIARDNTIVVGSNRWNAAQTFDSLTPVQDDNILYSFHFYNPLLFTHQKAPWIIFDEINQERNYPGEYHISDPEFRQKQGVGDEGVWNRDRMRQNLDKVLEFRTRYKLPVSCNEFGVYHQAPRESQFRWLSDFLSLLDEFGIGYSYWNYKNLDFGIVSNGEQLHANLPQFQNPQRRDEELSRLLTRS